MTNVQRSRRQVRLSRALGIALTPKAQRIFEKRPYAPGEHGRTRRRTESDYAVRLREKQRLRAQYGVSEKQLRSAYEKATRTAGQTIQVRAKSQTMVPFQIAAEGVHRDVLPPVPGYLDVNLASLKATLTRKPEVEEIPVQVNIQYVVEFYAR